VLGRGKEIERVIDVVWLRSQAVELPREFGEQVSGGGEIKDASHSRSPDVA